jgi:hypothetical protein
MFKGKVLFLAAALSCVCASGAFAYCSVVGTSPVPLVNSYGQTVHWVYPGSCFAVLQRGRSWVFGYEPGYQGNRIATGRMWAGSVDCRITCVTYG